MSDFVILYISSFESFQESAPFYLIKYNWDTKKNVEIQ